MSPSGDPHVKRLLSSSSLSDVVDARSTEKLRERAKRASSSVAEVAVAVVASASAVAAGLSIIPRCMRGAGEREHVAATVDSVDDDGDEDDDGPIRGDGGLNFFFALSPRPLFPSFSPQSLLFTRP